MPIPLAPAIPWVISALGGGLLWEWVSGESDEWGEAEVFNARMRDIHSGILQLNDLIARCDAMHSNAGELASWRAFVQNFSKFYADVGKRYFDPPQGLIDEARRQAAALATWIDRYKKVCGSVPTGVQQIARQTSMPQAGLSPWIGLGLLAAIGGAAYVFSKKRR
jgi:hypothetical protein